ncbi:hypothetical protein OOK41_08410 [Micromonospora sp. NBC_01655]|uniref:hypothetical protein n=1 Tax=Micromonospora sp. NBC_01655 TaxID=2975983 RepID=UPI0022593606|nr:hypothetical protein [Micromonospora sp. NBC_01655]MCX4470325.1 hypothetical protein [Micromonospora sp. NBC_01655]
MAGGTAAAAGTEMGQSIYTMVRDRLVGTDRGSTALRAVEDRPDDPAAIDELRTLLQAEVDADPGFAEGIAAALAATKPTRTTTGSITFEGTTVRGRNIFSLGPVTVSNTRNVRLSLLAAALVFVALVALGIYGGAHLIAGDDPVHSPTDTTRGQADPGSDSPPKESAKTAPETTGELADAILGRSDVPESWVQNGWTGFPALPADWPCDALRGSLPGSFGVSNNFGSGSAGMSVDIQMHSDPAGAEQALAWRRTNEEQCLHGRPVAVTPMGDETVGYQYAGHSDVYIRDGSYLITVMTSGDLPDGLTAYYARKQYERFTEVIR